MVAPFEARSQAADEAIAQGAGPPSRKVKRFGAGVRAIAKASSAEEQLTAEIESLKAELEHQIAERANDRARAAMDIRRLRVAHAQAEQRLINIRKMITYRLGDAIMSGMRSWSGFAAMPGKLTGLWREARKRGAQRHATEPAVLPSLSVLDAVESGMKEFRRGGVEAVLAFIDTYPAKSASTRAAIASELAKEAFDADAAAGLRIGRKAIAIEAKAARIKWFAFKLFEAGEVREAKTWLDQARAELPAFKKTSETLQAKEIDNHYALLSKPFTLPPRAPRAFEPVRDRIAYVVSSAQPFHNTGYTNRTQSIAVALAKAGFETQIFARPGYPYDRTDVSIAAGDLAYGIEGVPYRISPERFAHDTPVTELVTRAASALERAFREFRPAIVQAASDHRNALPALIAARRLGIPFVYEVRGMWEFTKASRRISWEGTERFQVVTQLETLCGGAADAVFTLTAAMRDLLAQYDVGAAKIAMAPNCVDPQRFRPRPRDEAMRANLGFAPDDFVLGYAGAIVAYEGLDDLIFAIDLLRERLPKLRVLITGEGSHKPALAAMVHQHDLQDIVRLAGRVSPSEISRHLASIDAYVVPRRPELVCQLVSPLKPLEGMAMQKPVIVSDVRGMDGMVEDGKTGFVFHAGDYRALAQRIADCAGNPERTAAVALAGRRFVERERNWDLGTAEMVKVFKRLQG